MKNNKDKNIKILVVTHKEYEMPKDRDLYLPIQSGSSIWPDLKIQHDNEGENISDKNLAYNELCPMFWAWKNIKSDVVGVTHYRRLFANDKNSSANKAHILTYEAAQKICSEYSIILPPKKQYYFSTVKKHYINSLKGYEKIHANDIKALKEAISIEAPEYLNAFEKVMNGRSAHMLHMCLMSRSFYNKYCEFMFPIMFTTEKILSNRVDKNRFIGALSEFLMDIWIEKNNYSYYELGIVELEKQIFIKKVIAVIKRKFIENKGV